MSKRLRDLRNLGPATEKMLWEVDINSETELRKVGTIEAYRRLKFRFGRHVTILALYAIEGALTDCDWRAIDSEKKESLRQAAAR